MDETQQIKIWWYKNIAYNIQKTQTGTWSVYGKCYDKWVWDIKFVNSQDSRFRFWSILGHDIHVKKSVPSIEPFVKFIIFSTIKQVMCSCMLLWPQKEIKKFQWFKNKAAHIKNKNEETGSYHATCNLFIGSQ